MRVDLEIYGDGRISDGGREEKRLEACDGGYHGVGESGDVSDLCEIAEPYSRVSGEESSQGWLETSSKLCASGSDAAFDGESLCACALNEADEEGGEEIGHEIWAGL